MRWPGSALVLASVKDIVQVARSKSGAGPPHSKERLKSLRTFSHPLRILFPASLIRSGDTIRASLLPRSGAPTEGRTYKVSPIRAPQPPHSQGWLELLFLITPPGDLVFFQRVQDFFVTFAALVCFS